MGAAQFWRRLGIGLQVVRGVVKFRLAGARTGRYPRLPGTVRIDVGGQLTAGHNFLADGRWIPVALSVADGGVLTIGDNVYLNGGVDIEAHHEIRIGNNVIMAPNVAVIDDDRHRAEPASVCFKGATVVGDNTWIGRNVVVTPGVTIGSGSVIGANAVVTSDIPENCFAAGAPARVVRKLDIPEGWLREPGIAV